MTKVAPHTAPRFLVSPVERVEEVNNRLVHAPAGKPDQHSLGVNEIAGVVPVVELAEELVGGLVVPRPDDVAQLVRLQLGHLLVDDVAQVDLATVSVADADEDVGGGVRHPGVVVEVLLHDDLVGDLGGDALGGDGHSDS